MEGTENVRTTGLNLLVYNLVRLVRIAQAYIFIYQKYTYGIFTNEMSMSDVRGVDNILIECSRNTIDLERYIYGRRQIMMKTN